MSSLDYNYTYHLLPHLETSFSFCIFCFFEIDADGTFTFNFLKITLIIALTMIFILFFNNITVFFTRCSE